MASDAVQTSPTAAAGAAPPAEAVQTAPPAPATPPGRRALPTPWPLKALKALASLRLTVALLALSMVLIFVGTLAQIDGGIWTIVSKYFRCFVAWVPLQLFVQFGQKFFGVPATARLPGSFPFPGGYVLGGLMLVNLLAAHSMRFRMTWRRSGIMMIHAGLILLLVGELITALASVESNMIIHEGRSASYAIDTREVELVVIDNSGDEADVVSVPGSRLRKGGVVRADELPFDVEVTRWLASSRLRQRAGGDGNPADRGLGKSWSAAEAAESAGAAAKQTIDVPSAYVTVRSKDGGKELGTYLVSAWFQERRAQGEPVASQSVRVGGRRYQIELRRTLHYKPYALHLVKFRFDRYMGTSTPKNYSSEVRLVDAERGEDRVVTIRMNEPLRYRGDTYYQSNFDHETERTTILQVVRNPGWFLPYAACVVVCVGMVAHFGLSLAGFLRRKRAAS